MTEVIAGTPKTEVYLNELGGVCIKQESFDFMDEDPYVYFSINEADSIIRAIKNVVKEAKEVKDGQ